jgi:hypothetical protein
MPGKLLIGLAPVLAALAFAAVPTVAQAAPHYYRNASTTSIPEGEKVPVLEWGKLSLTLEPAIAWSTTCETVSGGYVENPVGGGAGIGATLRFAAWNCGGGDGECPAGEIEIGGNRYEKEYEMLYPPQSFPWPSVLEEPEPTVVRTNSTDVVIELSCVAHKLTRSAAGEGGSKGAGENEQYQLEPAGPCVTDPAEGYEQKPQNEKGINEGPNQSKLVFNAGHASVACAGGQFGFRIHESLRIMGFKASELITAH